MRTRMQRHSLITAPLRLPPCAHAPGVRLKRTARQGKSLLFVIFRFQSIEQFLLFAF